MSNLHSFISIGALLPVSFLSLRFKAAMLENSMVETENKIYLTAFPIVNNLIEKIK